MKKHNTKLKKHNSKTEKDSRGRQKDLKQLSGDGQTLQVVFNESNIVRAELARKLGVSKNTITNLINSHQISTQWLLKIQVGLGFDISGRFPVLREFRQISKVDTTLEEVVKSVESNEMVRISKVEYDKLIEIQSKFPIMEKLIESQESTIKAQNEHIEYYKSVRK